MAGKGAPITDACDVFQKPFLYTYTWPACALAPLPWYGAPTARNTPSVEREVPNWSNCAASGAVSLATSTQ